MNNAAQISNNLEQAFLYAGFEALYAERKEYTDRKGVLVADWMVVGQKG